MRLAIVVGCMLLVACDQPTDPIAPPTRRLIVEAVLDAGAPFQSARVHYIDSGVGHQLVDVRDALVRITTPSGETFDADTGINTQTGALIYRVLGLGYINQPLVPGATYTLTVRTPAGEEVTGTTTMPAFSKLPDQLEVVAAPFERGRDTLRLSWARVPLAASYEVSVESDEGSGFSATYVAFADTSITIAGSARNTNNDAVFGGRVALVHVSAVDDNYYTYYHPNVDPFAGAPPSRLTGALGVFGAIAPVIIRGYSDIR